MENPEWKPRRGMIDMPEGWYQHDWRVIDENGAEVWASKLAARYRAEMAKRRAWDWR